MAHTYIQTTLLISFLSSKPKNVCAETLFTFSLTYFIGLYLDRLSIVHNQNVIEFKIHSECTLDRLRQKLSIDVGQQHIWFVSYAITSEFVCVIAEKSELKHQINSIHTHRQKNTITLPMVLNLIHNALFLSLLCRKSQFNRYVYMVYSQFLLISKSIAKPISKHICMLEAFSLKIQIGILIEKTHCSMEYCCAQRRSLETQKKPTTIILK